MSESIFRPPEWMPAAFDCPKCGGRVFYFMLLPTATIALIKCDACPWQEDPRHAKREARRISRLSPAELMAYHNSIFHPDEADIPPNVVDLEETDPDPAA